MRQNKSGDLAPLLTGFGRDATQYADNTGVDAAHSVDARVGSLCTVRRRITRLVVEGGATVSDTVWVPPTGLPFFLLSAAVVPITVTRVSPVGSPPTWNAKLTLADSGLTSARSLIAASSLASGALPDGLSWDYTIDAARAPLLNAFIGAAASPVTFPGILNMADGNYVHSFPVKSDAYVAGVLADLDLDRFALVMDAVGVGTQSIAAVVEVYLALALLAPHT
jgi:hypothetical protein